MFLALLKRTFDVFNIQLIPSKNQQFYFDKLFTGLLGLAIWSKMSKLQS
jgi:hypothetical protein